MHYSWNTPGNNKDEHHYEIWKLIKMKILQVASDLYPYSVGGVGLHTHELSNCMARKGHEVEVIFNVKKNTQLLNSTNYKLNPFKPGLKIFGNSVNILMFFLIFKKSKNIDIIHAHSHLFFSTVLATLAARLRKKPLVVTNHGLVSQTAPMWLQKIYLPTIGKWIFSRSNAVICYTNEMKDEMAQWNLPVTNVNIIHNGIDVNLFKPQNNIKKEYDILWIGRYTPGKDPNCLVDSLSILKKSHPEFKALLIGEGPLENEIKKKVSDLELEQNIEFKNRVNNDELPVIYNKSRLFTLTSLEEGVPRTILEAMSCGTPVVCTALPQLKKIISGCGILVQKKDTIGFSKAYQNLLEKTIEYVSLSKASREKAFKNYSWDDTVEKTLELYQKVIK